MGGQIKESADKGPSPGRDESGFTKKKKCFLQEKVWGIKVSCIPPSVPPAPHLTLPYPSSSSSEMLTSGISLYEPCNMSWIHLRLCPEVLPQHSFPATANTLCFSHYSSSCVAQIGIGGGEATVRDVLHSFHSKTSFVTEMFPGIKGGEKQTCTFKQPFLPVYS